MEVEKYLQITPRLQLHYRIDKLSVSQPAIILVHGLSSNMTRWTEFLQYTSLNKSWTTLRLDLRGHGASLYRGKLTTAIWAEDIRRVMQHENIERAIFVGHSLGARIAAKLAEQDPEKVMGMIFIDPVVPEALQGQGLLLSRLGFVFKAAIILLRLLNRLGLHRRTIPPRDLHKLDEATRELLKTQSHESIAKHYMNPWIDLRYNPLVNYLQDMIETLSVFPDIRNSDIPVHILLSAGGSISNVRQLEEYFRRGRRVTIEHIDADHWPLTEQPHQTREAIERWIEKGGFIAPAKEG